MNELGYEPLKEIVIHIGENKKTLKNRVIHIVIHIIHIKTQWISSLHSIIFRIYVLVKMDKMKLEKKREFRRRDL